ncbi:hypothetical protein [Clostridium estertheticum]|uniref:hypothetical protein n=1 Tax=Clostridium estertheticum TaxID=238834 RepID=UPI001C0CDF0B|nr:hypothetical protein [Clostridium estertheticum]MBU3075595.1 hypothetical protein [Clostridium estertheticum]MBU3164823.1 hypothetical protein [Clostridium estertheticum]
MRIQFYPSSNLELALNDEAIKLGVNVSTLVNDLLNMHYGLIPAKTLSNSQLEKKVFEEISEFVNNPSNVGEEFDLNKASVTYSDIEMVYAGKPHTIKAQIGKKFNNKLVGVVRPFTNVQQVRLPNNKPKRTVSNRAAVYVCKKPDDTIKSDSETSY